MFKHTATDLDKHPTPMQQRLRWALKNERMVPDGCWCPNDRGNIILFRINWRCVKEEFNVTP